MIDTNASAKLSRLSVSMAHPKTKTTQIQHLNTLGNPLTIVNAYFLQFTTAAFVRLPWSPARAIARMIIVVGDEHSRWRSIGYKGAVHNGLICVVFCL